jgi:hypothetical protein
MIPSLDPQVALSIRIALALLFAVAGIGKLCPGAGFEATLSGYRLLPAFSLKAVAVVLPIFEILLAGGLAIAALEPWPEVCAAGLLVLFAGAMAINLARGRSSISCGCSFGGGDKELRWGAIGRNLVLAGLIGISALTAAASQLASILIAAACGLSLFALYGALDAVWSLFARHPAPPLTRRYL